jgi:hypothetical protein
MLKPVIVFAAGVIVGKALFTPVKEGGVVDRTVTKVARHIGGKLANKFMDYMYEADERDAVYDQYADAYRTSRRTRA